MCEKTLKFDIHIYISLLVPGSLNYYTTDRKYNDGNCD